MRFNLYDLIRLFWSVMWVVSCAYVMFCGIEKPLPWKGQGGMVVKERPVPTDCLRPCEK